MPLKNKRKQDKARKNAQLRAAAEAAERERDESMKNASAMEDSSRARPPPAGSQSFSPADAADEENSAPAPAAPSDAKKPEQSAVVPAASAVTANSSFDKNLSQDEQDLNALEEQALTEDIYSLMSTMPFFSVGYLFSFVIFTIQLGILVLVLIDLIDMSDDPIKTNGVVNRLNIPADAGIPVTVAQFLGVILIVNFAVAEGDMVRGIAHLLDGHDPQLLEQYPQATRLKWISAGICQASVGAMMIIDAFCLMMSGNQVISIILNFAALDFVQYFDDAAFAFGAFGLINRNIQIECARVGKITVQTRSRNKTIGHRRLVVMIMTVALYVPYFILAYWKLSGRFMCDSLFVQFGDAYGPEWPYYSGVFNSLGKGYQDRFDGRLIYVDQSDEIQLSYCNGLKAWTFSNRSETLDPCEYFIKSSETLGFDIMDIAGDTWYALTPNLGNVPMDWMAVTCADCDELSCDPNVGVCINNQCKCKDGFMGFNCEFEVPTCEFLGLDQRTKASLPSLPFASLFMENEYVRIFNEDKADRFYDRPLYVSYNEDGHLDVFIVFTGRRWVIMGIPQDKAYTLEEEDPIQITSFLQLLRMNDPVNRPFETLKNVSATLSNFEPLFFSTPNDYGTPSHRVDPISATWFLAEQDDSLPVLGYKSDDSRGVTPSFICSHCNDTTNPCQNEGRCNATSTYCDCTESYGGFLCEYSYNCGERGCLNGGTCDEVFNICKDCNIGYFGNLCQFKRPGVTDFEIAANGDGDFFLCFNGTTCLNGGWCESNITTCACPPDFSGDYCEELSDNSTLFSEGAFICANSSCINGGWCEGEATECSCPPTFTGLLCEQSFSNTSIAEDGNFFHCSNSTCLNGGYCGPILTDPCICTLEYEGDYCESSIGLISGHNLCKNETCQNGGYCTSIVEVCTCTSEWFGDFCEKATEDAQIAGTPPPTIPATNETEVDPETLMPTMEETTENIAPEEDFLDTNETGVADTLEFLSEVADTLETPTTDETEAEIPDTNETEIPDEPEPPATDEFPAAEARQGANKNLKIPYEGGL